MRVLITLASIMVFSMVAEAQNIVQGEYFYNSDPGFGKGFQIDMPSPATDISIDFSISELNSLADGIHTIYFRFKDSEGVWSHTYKRVFIKQTPKGEARNIDYFEYYFGDDPGLGNGIEVPVTDPENEITIDFTADLQGLSPGFHTIGFRPRNAYGVWGNKSERIFFIKENRLSNIVKVEYFFTTSNFRSDTLSAPVAVPAQSIDLDFIADISDLTEGESYLIHVMAVTEGGERTEVAVRSFEIELKVTSISEEANVDVRVYPNPTSDKLQIQFESTKLNMVNIELLDGSGRMLKNIAPEVYTPLNKHLIIDMTEFSNGLYFLNVNTGEGTNIYKVVKQ